MSLCVGAHVPFTSFEDLQHCPFECIQIYFGNNSDVSMGQLQAFQRSGKKLFVHASLMYNLCGSKEGEDSPKYKRNLEFARNGLLKDLDICAVLGATLVVHVGAAKDRTWGISKVAETVDFVLSEKSSVTDKFSKDLGRDIRKERVLLLENSAGEGTKLGRDIPELFSLWSQIKNKEKTKFCIDTCHGFASGTMDFGTKDGIRDFWKEWDEYFPRDSLSLFHLNDSKTPFGSRVDRHETLLCGYIWDEKPHILEFFLGSAKERSIPLILERKDDTIEREILVCKALVK
ncbi:putative endonuclease 4 [Brazilian marseillevirus]|uniref:putative endonuclease 4 n=1 Tax=Brazilian marseillevirus TaxID=1813599 RepID=UPI000781D404|nr:putative endonuclease 4 [Brazilian marseillevirus]AMQ10857.1 putative endonuclease 4 [Brazilian marseillevirus]